MSTLFNPMAMTGMHPARRLKKNAVNYCFKSSCEINETLITLCWLKRSLTTFNRLFNHTQLELCVRSFLPLLNTEACTSHANKPLLAEMAEQMKTLVKIRYPLNVIRAYDHQKHSWPSRIMYCSFASHIFIITAYHFSQTILRNFGFSASFKWGLCCPSLLSTFYFKWSVLWEKTGFHTHCQSLFLLILPYLYFQLFFFFCHTSFGCADIDANTMCLFISLTRAWRTFLCPGNEEKPS